MNDDRLSRSRELLASRESLLFIVDLQVRLLPHIADHETVTSSGRRLLKGAALFEIPVVVSEQYPKGLGPTVPAIRSLTAEIPSLSTFEKLQFSGADAEHWPAAGERTDGRRQVVLAGIETHICILQTACDLLARGYSVYVVVDAVGSRHRIDHETALARLRDSGAVVTTAESVLFEWCESAESEKFRSLRDLVTGTT